MPALQPPGRDAVAEVVYRDRAEGGAVLAERLDGYRRRADVVVLALPRGGVPVAFEVARALQVPLDVFPVRKLGVPGHEELAMGALGPGGALVLNDEVVGGLAITDAEIQTAAAREQRELERQERTYREGRPPLDVAGKVVILVDDGLATGSTMKAAAQAVRRLGPTRVVVAVPTAPLATCRELGAVADEVICGMTPEPFHAVGLSYRDFSQTPDDEVRELLRRAAPGPDRPRTEKPEAGPP